MSNNSAKKRKAGAASSSDDTTDSAKKQLYSSRRNAKLATISIAAKELSATIEKDDEEVEGKFWREKYDLLNAEQAEATSELQMLLKLSSEREAELERHRDLLEKKIKLMEESAGRVTSSADSADEIVRFYRILTATNVDVEAVSGSSARRFKCTTTNGANKQATQFQLTLDESSTSNGELDYLPLKNSALLPDYLKSHIKFEPAMAPVMFGDILQNIFVDESEE